MPNDNTLDPLEQLLVSSMAEGERLKAWENRLDRLKWNDRPDESLDKAIKLLAGWRLTKSGATVMPMRRLQSLQVCLQYTNKNGKQARLRCLMRSG
jgi:hypothetical protein